VSFELIGKARELAEDLDSQVVAILLGYQVADLAQALVSYGAQSVLIADRMELEHYRTELYTQVISKIIDQYKPEIFLFGATSIGRDLAPRVAGRIHTGLTADCTALE